jgi:hypothetical protein
MIKRQIKGKMKSKTCHFKRRYCADKVLHLQQRVMLVTYAFAKVISEETSIS